MSIMTVDFGRPCISPWIVLGALIIKHLEQRMFWVINTAAYHEGCDLIKQVESYKELHGHYPELVQVDKIYATRENRIWLAEKDIRITAVSLGRRKGKEKETYYQKRKRRNEAA